jgi:hypothetical protein
VCFYLEGLAEFDDAVVGAALRSRWRWSGDFAGFAVPAERCVDRGGGVVEGKFAGTVCLMRFVCCKPTLCISRFRRFPNFSMSFYSGEGNPRRDCLPPAFFLLMPLMLKTIIGWSSEKPWLARTEGYMPSTLKVLLVLEGETGGLVAFVGDLDGVEGPEEGKR